MGDSLRCLFTMTLPFGCPEGTMFAPFDNRGSCDVGRSQGRAAARPWLRPTSHDPRLSKGANMVPSGQPKGNVIVKRQRRESPMTTQGSVFGLSPNLHHLENVATMALLQEHSGR